MLPPNQAGTFDQFSKTVIAVIAAKSMLVMELVMIDRREAVGIAVVE